MLMRSVQLDGLVRRKLKQDARTLACVAAFAGFWLFSPMAIAQSSLGDGGLSGAVDAWRGLVERYKQQQTPPPQPAGPDPQVDGQSPASRNYYPDAGSGTAREQIRRSQGAHDSIYGSQDNLNCGVGCRMEGSYCTCTDPADVGGARVAPSGGPSTYEGGGATPDDIVGDPGWDGNAGLPQGN